MESGAIGEVVSVRAVYRGQPAVWTDVLGGAGGQGDRHGVATDATTGKAKPWRYDLRLTGGGVTIDGGAHWLRPMALLTPGRIVDVVGVTGRPFAAMEGESFARALCRFDSGVVSTFETDWGCQYGDDPDFKVIGTTGEVQCVVGGSGRDDNPHGTTTLWNATHPQGRVEATEPVNGHGKVIEDFAHAVLSGREPAASAEDSLGELRTALALYKSARTVRAPGPQHIDRRMIGNHTLRIPTCPRLPLLPPLPSALESRAACQSVRFAVLAGAVGESLGSKPRKCAPAKALGGVAS